MRGARPQPLLADASCWTCGAVEQPRPPFPSAKPDSLTGPNSPTSLPNNGADRVRPCVQTGAEGVVSKKVDGRYQSGRCRFWIKVRNPASIAVQRSGARIGINDPADEEFH
jgi:hypothetical protein